MFTLKELIELFVEIGTIYVFFDKMTFQFNMDNVPEEILDCVIKSIDNPEYTDRPQPLCVNLDVGGVSDKELETFKFRHVEAIVDELDREDIKDIMWSQGLLPKEELAYGYRRPTDKEKEDLVKQGYMEVDARRGYMLSQYNSTGMLEITTLLPHVFGDGVAAQQAKRDGISLIPLEELPRDFNLRYEGWIDTPSNREAIRKYCLKNKISNERINKALEILKDNGVEEDECIVVLQALGYALLDIELFN